MPLGLSFIRDSLYNYGGISPNNLVSYIATYNPVYYVSTGGYFGTGSTVYDLTTNKNNFTLTNAYSYSGGISLSGSNGYIVSGNLISYFPSFNSQTQEIWFKNAYYNETGTNGVLLNEWGVNTPDTNWYYSQMEIVGGTGYIGIYNNLGLNKLPVGRFIDGIWHCISWRYDGSVLSGFVDGIKTATGTFSRLTPPNLYVGIGAKNITNMGNGNYFKGLIGSYRLYNRSLTDSEILQNYNYERQFFTVLTAGNATTSMTITGLTSLAGVLGQDDAAATIPGINFDFYFFGTNYGNGLNSGIYWSSNNVLGFGTPDSTITWTATTGRGVLIGNFDRRTNNFYYSTTQYSSGFYYKNCLLFAQNVYNDGVANAIQYQLRFFRSSNVQYIEVRCKQAPSTAGSYNITNGTTFQNTYGSYTNLVANQSFVLSSDSSGNNWKFYNNSYINL
jgi:hypothetical protein